MKATIRLQIIKIMFEGQRLMFETTGGQINNLILEDKVKFDFYT